jgi:osmoprotectant transport system permease protein
MPVIVAGIRTSAVWTVGATTLPTPVGAPSLGNYIFGGLQTRNYVAVLVGCTASALLALAIDALVRLIAAGLEARRGRSLVVGVLGLALLASYAAAPQLRALIRADRAPVTVGAKTFTESYVLAHILAGEIARDTHAPTRTIESLGSSVAFDALRSGEIDTYVDYSGTLWANVLHRDGDSASAPPDRAQILAELEGELPKRFGVHVIASLGFENTYALAMRRADANRLSVTRISDLAPIASRLRVGADYELFQRPEWRSITRTYGLAFAEQRTMDPSLLYEAAKTGEVDVIGAYSTDGRIAAFDLAVLDDDRHAIPPYDALILASDRFVRAHPEGVAALRRLSGRIDAERMRSMNKAVDQDGRTPASVAEDFLRSAP